MNIKIVGRRIVLDQFCQEDISDDYVGWLNDKEVVKYSNQRFRHHDLKTCESYRKSFLESDNLFLSVRLLHTNEMIGTMTVYISPHHQTGDVGMMIGRRAQWGKGYGSEAWDLLLRYLLQDRSLRKVTAGTLRCNIGMVTVIERSGMELEAVRSRQELVIGEPQDILYFAKFGSD